MNQRLELIANAGPESRDLLLDDLNDLPVRPALLHIEEAEITLPPLESVHEIDSF